jgi:hypothetical protein
MYTMNDYITRLVDDERTGHLRSEAATHRLARVVMRGRRGHQPRGGRGQPAQRAWVPRQQRRHPQEEHQPSPSPKDDPVSMDLSTPCAA